MRPQQRVLVVDDDDGVRTSVTWALEADGFEVESVNNGNQVVPTAGYWRAILFRPNWLKASLTGGAKPLSCIST